MNTLDNIYRDQTTLVNNYFSVLSDHYGLPASPTIKYTQENPISRPQLMGYVFTHQNSCDINPHQFFIVQVDQNLKAEF